MAFQKFANLLGLYSTDGTGKSPSSNFLVTECLWYTSHWQLTHLFSTRAKIFLTIFILVEFL
ncbi:MAG: hypothetical protein HY882_08795 [Deltaproteobacteria bacterium]|nr:hypothetical protein [Deltaproteobacteria bacterium]